ncbi:Kinase, NEK [Giardia muris]|uniref:non-specific serine/threonine protein kinase n=1 Tax=Giardia muris TaxID=5742 RepID=A0A4Z1SP48_GIAMU|nr:Kinase, NEK [Giardia muris]|eukprot:TNJ27592.1 Kinase, NEK [Giardia muris]
MAELDYERFCATYQLQRVLGTGPGRSAFLARSRRTGARLYCKKFDLEGLPASARVQLRTDVDAMLRAQGCGVLCFEHVCLTPLGNELFFLQPDLSATQASLRVEIDRHRGAGTRFTPDYILRVATQLLLRLDVLHRPGRHGIRPAHRLVHCALKPSNVFVSPDLTVTLVDALGVTLHQHCNSPNEEKPSSSPSPRLGPELDLLGLGKILHEMCTLRPWEKDEETGEEYPVELRDLISCLLGARRDGLTALGILQSGIAGSYSLETQWTRMTPVQSELRLAPADGNRLSSYCRYLEIQAARLREDVVVIDALRYKYLDELNALKARLPDADRDEDGESDKEVDMDYSGYTPERLANRLRRLERRAALEHAEIFVLRQENAALRQQLRQRDFTAGGGEYEEDYGGS